MMGLLELLSPSSLTGVIVFLAGLFFTIFFTIKFYPLNR